MANYYAYLRVSTVKQDIGRQVVALNEWQDKNNITIPQSNIFTDYYTGKTFNRENYQKLKQVIKQNDYLIVKEVDRLGRDWDGIKKEWQELKNNGINIIIIDIPILSDNLPSERPAIEGLDLRLIKEQILSLMCYSAQKEREKLSQRTKEGLANVKKNGSKSGMPIGRPRTRQSSVKNFINVLEYMIEKNVGQDKATFLFDYPTPTFKKDIKKYYEKYNTKDYEIILENIKKEMGKK